MAVRGLCGNRDSHVLFWSMIYVALELEFNNMSVQKWNVNLNSK